MEKQRIELAAEEVRDLSSDEEVSCAFDCSTEFRFFAIGLYYTFIHLLACSMEFFATISGGNGDLSAIGWHRLSSFSSSNSLDLMSFVTEMLLATFALPRPCVDYYFFLGGFNEP